MRIRIPALAWSLIFLAVFAADRAYSFPGNPAPENVGMLSQSVVVVPTTGVQLLAANINRNALILQNQSAASTVSISFGSAAGNSTINLTAGTLLQISPAFTDSIYAKSAAGAITTLIIEGVK